MDQAAMRELLEDLNISPEASVPILNSVKYGGQCSCKKDLQEAQMYIRNLEQQIRELRDRLM